MKEIWELAVSPQVLPFTLLLIPIALYWLLAMIGAIDLDFLDIDLDFGSEVDAIPDVDTDVAVDTGDGHHLPGSGILHSTLRIVGATDVPIMAIMSIIIVFLWAGAMIGNLWLNPGQNSFFGLMIGLGSLVTAVILARLVTHPLRPFFRALKKGGVENRPAIGRTGVVRSGELTEEGGQVIIEEKGDQLFLNARLMPGSTPLKKGREVLVYKYDKESGIYYVRCLTDL